MAIHNIDLSAANIDHRAVARVAKATPRRQLEMVKPGPVTIYTSLQQTVEDAPKPQPQLMSVPPVLRKPDTEAGKVRAVHGKPATFAVVPREVWLHRYEGAEATFSHVEYDVVRNDGVVVRRKRAESDAMAVAALLTAGVAA